MNSYVLMYVSLAALAVLVPACVVLWLRDHDIHPLNACLTRFRRLPRLAQIALVVFVANLIVYGSTKAPTNGVPGDVSSPTNGVPDDVSSPTNAPTGRLMLLARSLELPFVSGFTAAELAVGYAVWYVGTNEVWDFTAPSPAAIVEPWRLRGAAEDWVVREGRVVTSDARIWPSEEDLPPVCSAVGRPLALVPFANWDRLPETNDVSLAWQAVTPWESFVAGWSGAILERDPSQPLCVEAEISRAGDVLFSYDLSRAGSAVTNAVASIARGEARVEVPLTTNTTSVLFYKLRPADLVVDDRDGDGVSTWDEINIHHTDPGLVDTDGDGLPDGDEIRDGTDPRLPSVPNEEIVARVLASPTNELYAVETVVTNRALTGLKLWDGFAADWSGQPTNLVYERTFDLQGNDWQHYFLSSCPDAAGDWDLRGLVLEWDDGTGLSGRTWASSLGDSYYLPLTNGAGRVTIRLWATAPQVRAAKPMYLVGYVPQIVFEGATEVRDDAGDLLALVVTGDGSGTVPVRIDRTNRPSVSSLHEQELQLLGLDELEMASDGKFTYCGDASGGVVVVNGAGVCALPETGVKPLLPQRRGRDGFGTPLVFLDPSVSYGGEHEFAAYGLAFDPEMETYATTNSYPFNKECLWRGWHQDATGREECPCTPSVTSGADNLWFVTTDYRIDDDVATGYVYVHDQLVWTGRARHTWRANGGGMLWEDCDSCASSCAGGNCDAYDGSEMSSVSFRTSFGAPRRGQLSGFLWFESDEPVLITPSLFRASVRPEAQVTVTTSGSATTYACGDLRGRDTIVEPMTDGVRVTVRTHATGQLEHVWEIVNVDGALDRIRICQISRQQNIMKDETFVYAEDAWSKTDNISGARETLSRTDLLASDGVLYETRSRYFGTTWIDSTYMTLRRFGFGVHAVLRETAHETYSGTGWTCRYADYWVDSMHPARHGQRRLVWGNAVNWQYTDYDEDGRETVRVEQRGGSAVPRDFPYLTTTGELAGFEGLTDAFVTVSDYQPFADDANAGEENDLPRTETRYVARGGRLTCIGKTWRRYTHRTACGWPSVREETWRAASATSDVTDPTNAYSFEETFSTTAENVPIVLRGRVVYERDEDGSETEHAFALADETVVETVRRTFDGVAFPTYERVMTDAVFGNELSKATYLTAGDVLIDEETSVYDEKNRLRATAYADGTSLTNAYSCCRLLWSVDRLGRKTLRSAVTGRDRLYFANEEVWLRELTTNGTHKVTQHFVDGLGRETNAVVYVATEPGEATDGRASCGQEIARTTVRYPYGSDDYVETIDVRGLRRVVCQERGADRVEHLERVYASDDPTPALTTRRTNFRGGASVVETEWAEGWTRETSWSDYDEQGHEIRTRTTASSDYGLVTNDVTTCDFLGRVVRSETPRGETRTDYCGASSRVASVTTSAGDVVRTETPVYTDWGEDVGTVRDGVTNRQEVVYSVDGTGSVWRVTREVVSSADEVGRVAEEREQLTGRTAGVLSWRIVTEATGAVDETVVCAGATPGERVVVVSNAVSGVSVTTQCYGRAVAIATAERTAQFDFDALGRRTATRVLRDGDFVLETASGYAASGDLLARRVYTNATDYVTETYGCDRFGREVRRQDALGNVTETRYDVHGRILERSGATYPVRYTYDTAGRRTALETTKDGRIWDMTSWSYDPTTGDCTAKRYPDGSQVTYTVTPDGLPWTTTRASQRGETNVYNARRQLVATMTDESTVVWTSDLFDRLTFASNEVARTTYARQTGDVITNEVTSVGDEVRTWVRRTDGAGRVTARGFAGEALQSIAYDACGRVSVISNDEAVVTYAYAADGADLGAELRLANGTRLVRQIVRDAYCRDRIVAVTNLVNGVVVSAFVYGRDATGRVVSRVSTDGRTERFAYDALGQVELPDVTYDQIGNRSDAEGLAYSVDGEVLALGDLELSYDASGRLASVSTGGVFRAAYAYDAFGRRVRKTTDAATVSFFYDGWNLVDETRVTTNGVCTRMTYAWGKDISGALGTSGSVGGLLYVKQAGDVFVPFYDAGGNVVGYVDASGQVVASYAYDAFGVSVGTADGMERDFRFRYSTKYWDDETGLYDYGYRYYAPSVGRWLTRDPSEESGGLNLHAFCANDGVNTYDALGLAPEPNYQAEGLKFWRQIARDLHDELQYVVSREMLEKALEGKAKWAFEPRTKTWEKLGDTYGYKSKYQDFVQSASDDLSHEKVYSGVELDDSGDIHAAVPSVDIKFTGRVLHRKTNRDCVEGVRIKAHLEGVYQYDVSKYEDLLKEEEHLSDGAQIRRDMQTYRQLVQTYKWTVDYKDRK